MDVIEPNNHGTYQSWEKGLKNPIKVSGVDPKNELQIDRFKGGPKYGEKVGYFLLDSLNIDKSSKLSEHDDLDVEVFVHSDIDKQNNFIKVYSTKNEDLNVEKIPCNTVMMLVVTQFGQHMKMLECTQQDDRDFLES